MSLGNLFEKRTGFFNPADFQTRSERCKQLKIPDSSKRVVIVKPNNEAIGFRFDCYPKEFLHPDIEKQRFDETVLQAHKICETEWLKKRKEEEIDINERANYILALATFLVLASFVLILIMMYGSNPDSTEGDVLLIVSTILIAIAGGSTSILVVRTLFIRPSFMNLEQEIKTKLQAFLQKENNGFYKSLGFEWKMERNFYWLELHNRNTDRTPEFPVDPEKLITLGPLDTENSARELNS